MTKILVIEDEAALLEEILNILTFEDFEVVGAANGKLGVQLATEHLPDLIICDIIMPQLDGYGVLLELRNEPLTAMIPLIFLTAKADRGDWRTGMELGADDYITKPFTRDDLLTAIQTQLAKQAKRTKLNEQKIEALREHVLTALPHEMRTPLTGILGYAEVLILDGLTIPPEDTVQIGQVIYDCASRLHHVLDNYLSYIQIGLISEDPLWIEKLRDSATENPEMTIAERAQIVAQKAKREVDLILDLVQLPTVHMFKEHLKKIIEELLDNAFKFSYPGTPVHLATLTDGRTCTIRVSDQGRGMAPEQIAQVGMYVQFNRRIYEQRGLGMGLIIAKKLVELHGGQLTIESIPDQGTTITCILP